MSETLTSDAQRATAERDSVVEANAQSMSRLKAEFGITLPYATADSWRPTVRASGHLPGFDREFVILCTDGIVAWYIDRMDVLFYGHVQHFTGKIKPLHSVSHASSGRAADSKGGARAQRTTKRRKDKAPKVSLALALEALKNLAETAPR